MESDSQLSQIFTLNTIFTCITIHGIRFSKMHSWIQGTYISEKKYFFLNEQKNNNIKISYIENILKVKISQMYI